VSGRPGLRYEVLVSDMAPATSSPLPDGTPALWSPLSHTLIFGQREALLTDPPITRAQADVLAGWVRQHDVPLRYIYLTHGHADHWLATSYLLGSFPDAAVVATQAVLSRVTPRRRTESSRPCGPLCKAQYPGRLNPWSIWLSALHLFAS
jgi:glyoxylase-like metal-dependent hydrolase (beta-lactamase superfamily II)